MLKGINKMVKTSCFNYKKDIDTLCRCWLKILNNACKLKNKSKNGLSILENLKILNLRKNIYQIIKNQGSGLNEKDLKFLESTENAIKEISLLMDLKDSSFNEKLLVSKEIEKIKLELVKSYSHIENCLTKLKHYDLWSNNLRILKREVEKIKELPYNIKYLILKFLNEMKKICDSSLNCYKIALDRWECNKKLLELEINYFENKKNLNSKYKQLEETIESLRDQLCITYKNHRKLALHVNKNICQISYDYEKMLDELNLWVSACINNIYFEGISFLSETNFNNLKNSSEKIKNVYRKWYALKLTRIDLNYSLIRFILKLLTNNDLGKNNSLLSKISLFIKKYLERSQRNNNDLNKLKFYIENNICY